MAVHVVKAGENLWAISRRYGVSIQTIEQVNGLSATNIIVPGLSLFIPDITLPIRYYRVKAGDTLSHLALLYRTTVSNIVSANPGINPNLIQIGQIINIPSSIKKPISTLGFIVPYSLQTSLSILDTYANYLSYLAIVSYAFTPEGYAYVELEDTELIRRSKQRNIVPLLMIRNYRAGDFDRNLVGTVLANPILRRNLVLSIVNLANQRGYLGVSIDFEFIPPPQRNDFISFLTELKAAMGSLLLHVNVHAKTADIPTNPIIGAYDYSAIGKIADLVAVMTIDYGYPTGPPDPIAPIPWVEEVIKYAITQIDNRKLQMAFPLYGYDKVVPSNRTKSLSVLAAQNLAISSRVSISYNEVSKAPWYRYWQGTEEHIVWFEDIRSYIEKYKLMDLYGLTGSTYWQLSLPAPQNWSFVENNLNVVKPLATS